MKLNMYSLILIIILAVIPVHNSFATEPSSITFNGKYCSNDIITSKISELSDSATIVFDFSGIIDINIEMMIYGQYPGFIIDTLYEAQIEPERTDRRFNQYIIVLSDSLKTHGIYLAIFEEKMFEICKWEDAYEIELFSESELFELSDMLKDNEIIEGYVPKIKTQYKAIKTFENNTNASVWLYIPEKKNMIKIGGWGT